MTRQPMVRHFVIRLRLFALDPQLGDNQALALAESLGRRMGARFVRLSELDLHTGEEVVVGAATPSHRGQRVNLNQVAAHRRVGVGSVQAVLDRLEHDALAEPEPRGNFWRVDKNAAGELDL